MTASAEDIVASARMTIYQRHPYLSHALFALRPTPAPGLGSMATDEGWRMYYDPATMIEWQDSMVAAKLDKVAGQGQGHDGVAAAIFHELGHCMREHCKRRGERHPILWNFAGDREINDDLEEAGWRLPIKGLMPSDIRKVNGLTAEEYYHPLEAVIVNLKFITPGCGANCGGSAGNPTEWEKEHDDSDAPAPLDALEQDIILRQTANDIAKHVKEHGKGSVPSGLQAWAETRLEPAKIDWRKRLASLTRASLGAKAGASDWTWRKPGRRALHSAGRSGWPLAPSFYQPTPKVGVVLDTSGSMDADMNMTQFSKIKGNNKVIHAALSEVMGIAKASGAAVTVYACDAAVHAVAKVVSERDLERVNRGSGGTDMRPGFNAAKKERPDLIVIVTDGIVGDDWPSQEDCQRQRTLAVLVGASEHPPEWIPFVEAK
jgi:predicted metal-dependent peptidase